MKTAITIWNGRVAPVFDVAHQCLLLTGKNRETLQIPQGNVTAKQAFFTEQGIGQLICGAISREYEDALLASGVEVVSFIAGPVDLVIDAWNADNLVQDQFSMPGCGCRRRQCRHRGQGRGQGRGRIRNF